MNLIATLRRHWQAPAFPLAVIALVAAAVVVNAGAFGAIHALRWKALPYANGDELVDLRANLKNAGLVVGLNEHLRSMLDAERGYFSSTLGFTAARSNDEEGRTWHVARVTPEFSTTLGVNAVLGRGFVADDTRNGDNAVLVLGDAIWRSRFGADPDIVGRAVRLGDRSYTVIGVMPHGFAFPDTETEAWRPYVMTNAERKQSEGGNVGDLGVVARLTPGVSLVQANAALDALLAREPSVAGLRGNLGLVGQVRAWRDRYAASHWQALELFQLAALVLLAVVVANLVNLQLDRLLTRAREFEVRRAIGASDGAILRSVLTDLAPPVVVGLVVGLALTPFLTALLEHRDLLPADLPQGSGFDASTVFAAVTIAAIAMGSGMFAAWLMRRRARLSVRADIGGLGRTRSILLVGQVMLTTALLGSTALLLRSALNLIDSDRGFDARGVLLTLVDPVGVTIGRTYDAADEAKYHADVDAIRLDIAALPGVDHVAVATAPPFSSWEAVSTYRASGHTEPLQARGRGVGPGYFAALGIGLLAGREFKPTDDKNEPVIVDELYRERYLHNIDPIGASIEIAESDQTYRKATIVGVARTVKHEALDEDANLPTVYQYYEAPLPTFWLITHAQGDILTLAETVRRHIRLLVPGGDVGINRPLAELVDATLAPRRTLLEALAGFATATLLLAALGLAAVLGFAIRRRTAELGVRMALGATPSRVRNLVLRQGGALIGVGLTCGVVVGLAIARLLSDRLFHVDFTDPASWCVALALVAAVALFACWLPALRASRVDPVVALRDE